eukprot:TRINITY_DN9825_c0_g1_i1.p1 TRINITY_DN9825_c0_g1~~TRINITY_DN9825_c0_g1_i1.p1  ORF type:complete len:171 (-),score=36.95 TRINITY_DN9825_c0_g1_i1:85-597(-)
MIGDLCFIDLVSLSGSAMAFLSACKGIPVNVTIQASTLVVTPNFTTNASSMCEKIEIGIVPLVQFQYRVRRLLTSLAIYSETSQTRANATFIYNQQQTPTVVGELSSDGYYFNFDDGHSITGLEACFLLNTVDEPWHLRSDKNTYDLVLSEYPFKEFTILGLNLPLNSTT